MDIVRLEGIPRLEILFGIYDDRLDQVLLSIRSTEVSNPQLVMVKFVISEQETFGIH